jgi:hypothetical protein
MKYTKDEFMKLFPSSKEVEFAESCHWDFVLIYNNCPQGVWLMWLLNEIHQISRMQMVQVMVACAEHVLPLFEREHPNDIRPRLAIDAAKEWILNPSEENIKKTLVAAEDAYKAFKAAAADSNAALFSAETTTKNACAAYKVAYTAISISHAAYTARCAACIAFYGSSFTDGLNYAIKAVSYAAEGTGDEARKTEGKWQADKIREIIPCPFTN